MCSAVRSSRFSYVVPPFRLRWHGRWPLTAAPGPVRGNPVEDRYPYIDVYKDQSIRVLGLARDFIGPTDFLQGKFSIFAIQGNTGLNHSGGRDLRFGAGSPRYPKSLHG